MQTARQGFSLTFYNQRGLLRSHKCSTGGHIIAPQNLARLPRQVLSGSLFQRALPGCQKQRYPYRRRQQRRYSPQRPPAIFFPVLLHLTQACQG